ncbi:DUF6434 domain-containing protein [Mesorhizobium calcicola]|uniref:DUF6434 domain-containing protein n=1 Tax=Mesorhizobium calcicola TaxID=1300310 RepID=A0ABW4WJ79_9HYPH
MKPFYWHADPISRATAVTKSYRNTWNVRSRGFAGLWPKARRAHATRFRLSFVHVIVPNRCALSGGMHCGQP